MTTENTFAKILSTEKVPEREFKYGIIVALDALGISNYRVDEAKEYLRTQDLILKISKDFQIPYLKSIHSEYGKTISGPDTYSFGDTIILAWEMTEATETQEAAFIAADFVRGVFYSALLSRILLRGAISIGSYTSDEKGIIGPAIADAAAWYEEANWIGVIATPTLGICLETLDGLSGTEAALLPRFVKYDVPFHGNKIAKMWALAWPYEYWAQHGTKSKAHFAGMLEPRTDAHYKNMTIPYGAESKYNSAFAFCEYFVQLAEKVKPPSKFKVYADHLSEWIKRKQEKQP